MAQRLPTRCNPDDRLNQRVLAGTMIKAETDDQIGPSPADPEKAREFWPNRWHFHGLIQVRMPNPERRGLEGKPLESTARFDPVRLVIPV